MRISGPARSLVPKGASFGSRFVIIGILTTLLAAFGVAIFVGLPETSSSTVSSNDLYVSDSSPDGSSLRQFFPLDPKTLGDQENKLPIRIPNQRVLFSSDGSTLITLGSSRYSPASERDEVPVAVWDSQTNQQLAHFVLPFQPLSMWLSGDGTRFVIEPRRSVPAMLNDPSATEWDVFDTSDGHLRSRVTNQGSDRCDVDQTWVDSAAQRMYCFVLPDRGVSTNGPHVAHLIAYNLATGDEVGQITLPRVLAGHWQTARRVQGETVGANLVPGVALSLDGRQLAIVHADSNQVTLIDTQRFAVVRTVTFAPRITLLDQLPLAPQPVEAKGLWDSSRRQAVFSVDGQRLYVFGMDSRVADNGALNVHYGGVQRVDLTRQGTLTAVALAGQPVVTVVPEPDGQSVYVLGPDKTVGAGSGTTSNLFRLRRLDATTLTLLAERDFDGYRSVLLTSLVPRQNDEGR